MISRFVILYCVMLCVVEEKVKKELEFSYTPYAGLKEARTVQGEILYEQI